MRTDAAVAVVGRFAARVVLVLACALAAASAAGEVKAPEDIHPAGTMFFLSVKNPQGSEAFRDSALYKIAEEPEMAAFIQNVEDTCRSLLDAHAGEIPVDLTFIREMLSHEFSVAYTGMHLTEDQMPVPGMMISGVFDRDRSEVEGALRRTLAAAFGAQMQQSRLVQQHRGTEIKAVGPPENSVFYAFIGPRLLVASHPADLKTALDLAAGEGESLSARATFKHVMAKVGGRDSMLAVYADVKGLLEQFGPLIPPETQALLESLGAKSIKAAGFGSRFADGGIRDATYLYAPGARGGLLTPAPGPVDLAWLGMVPKDAQTVALGRLDLGRVYDLVLMPLASTDEQTASEFGEAVAGFEQKAGFSVREDLLASLGSQMLFSGSPDENILVIEYKDQAKLDSCIRKLAELAGGNAQLGELDYAGGTIHHLDITGAPVPLSPSYTYGDGFIALALYPQTLKGFLIRLRDGGENIRDNPDFQRVATRFLAGCDAISYSDAGGGLVDFYNLLVVAAHAMHGVKEVPIRAELMPPVSVVAAHVFGMGGGQINDADGILAESFSPVGSLGGALSAIGQIAGTYKSGGMMNAQMTAVMAAMLMPALARAREEARAAACMGNLHNIGLGLAMYRIDRDGAMPETLGTLYPVYLETVGTFVCPGDGSPMTIGQGMASSYYYVGSIPAGMWSPDLIIAYDKAGNHRNARNCLFADGHVERLHDRGFEARCRENLEQLKASAGWAKLSAVRRKQIEAFYSGTPAATGELPEELSKPPSATGGMQRIDNVLP